MSGGRGSEGEVCGEPTIRCNAPAMVLYGCAMKIESAGNLVAASDKRRFDEVIACQRTRKGSAPAQQDMRMKRMRSDGFFGVEEELLPQIQAVGDSADES